MLVATTSNILHTYFVSRLGPEAIAAVALVFPISLILLTVAAGGFGTGIASAVARALGAGRAHEATMVAEQAFLITIVSAVVLTIVLQLAAGPLFAAMGGRGEVLRQATLFGRILFAGLLCPFMVSTLDSILRAEGNVRIPATWATVSLALQILLTPIFIFTLGMGLAGAAVATLTGQALAAIPRMVFMFGGRGMVQPAVAAATARAPIREIIGVGIPASMSAAINYAGIILLTSVFARLGTAHLAAYGFWARASTSCFYAGLRVAQPL
jgi:Na+-driven multidrug efflux pump